MSLTVTHRTWDYLHPIVGGNANDYEDCVGDPINCYDIDGKFSFKKFWKKHGSSITLGLGIVAMVATGPVGIAFGIAAVIASVISAGINYSEGKKTAAAWDLVGAVPGVAAIARGRLAVKLTRAAAAYKKSNKGKRGVKAAHSAKRRAASIARKQTRWLTRAGYPSFARDAHGWYTSKDDYLRRSACFRYYGCRS